MNAPAVTASLAPPKRLARAPRPLRLGAALFSLGVFLYSWWLWWTFQYGTFDLAFYVQALWLALRGHWTISLLDVPLMGNHAEPIVFLLTPLFALCPHPMLLVAVQTLTLASMAFTGRRIALRMGFSERAALCLGLVTLLMPATSSVGVFEFHPEAFSAPLLLLLVEARLNQRLRPFWLWFIAVLACKENMALTLVTLCGSFAALECRRDRKWQLHWNVLPGLLAAVWLILCAKVISPALNGGNVNYISLYSHLGASGGEIIKNFLFDPSRALNAIGRSVTQGDLLVGLLLPLGFLPLMRLRWLLISAPLLLQHLLSWRFTEWSLGEHYAAPFIPLFWIAAVEVISRFPRKETVVVFVTALCLLSNVWFGPARAAIAQLQTINAKLEEREWKAALLATIPADASVTAAHPYLSHLATRENLHSLHHILKGLKTLSTEAYQPPPVSAALVIDYDDTSTFSTIGGFYHPYSHAGEGAFIPSSDRLLHEYLAQASWKVVAQNQLTILTQAPRSNAPASSEEGLSLSADSRLLDLKVVRDTPSVLTLRGTWRFTADRKVFPWMMLVLSDGRHLYPFTRGACAPEAGSKPYSEDWTVVFPSALPAGEYVLTLLFFDASRAAWAGALPPKDMSQVLGKIELGRRRLAPATFGEPQPAP